MTDKKRDRDYNQVEILSTKLQLKEFKESLIWKDILTELKDWQVGFDIERAKIVDDARDNNPSTASVLMHMGDINGRIKAVNYVSNLPDLFLQILESQKPNDYETDR